VGIGHSVDGHTAGGGGSGDGCALQGAAGAAVGAVGGLMKHEVSRPAGALAEAPTGRPPSSSTGAVDCGYGLAPPTPAGEGSPIHSPTPAGENYQQLYRARPEYFLSVAGLLLSVDREKLNKQWNARRRGV
jgi:hypothetical protein